MNRRTRRADAGWALTALALAAIVAGAGSLALADRGEGPVTTETPGAALESPAPVAAFSTARGGASHHVDHVDHVDHVAEPANEAPPSTADHETSVVTRLRARYRSEDLELLAAVSRRTSAPATPAIHRLLDAARAGADDAELTRIIREDVQGALVRHDCFDWLRHRRGEPRPKPRALASRGRTQPAR